MRSSVGRQLQRLREQNQTLEQVVAISPRYFDLTEHDEPERFVGYDVSSSFFDTLGVSPLFGRTFSPDEGEPGHQHVVVLKHNLWQRRFGADPNIVNQTIRLNGNSFTVIGVMPPGFNYPFNGGELWTPLVLDDRQLTQRSENYLQAMALLKPDVTIEQARQDLAAVAARAAEQFPETNPKKRQVFRFPRTRTAVAYDEPGGGAIGFVLLIALRKSRQFLMVRGAARQKESRSNGHGRPDGGWCASCSPKRDAQSAGGALGCFFGWGIEGLARPSRTISPVYSGGITSLLSNRFGFTWSCLC